MSIDESKLSDVIPIKAQKDKRYIQLPRLIIAST